MSNIQSKAVKMMQFDRLADVALPFGRRRLSVSLFIVWILVAALCSPVAAQVDCTDVYTADIVLKTGNDGGSPCNAYCTGLSGLPATKYTYCISAWDTLNNVIKKCSEKRDLNNADLSCYCSNKMVIPCTGFRVLHPTAGKGYWTTGYV
jgi:hypothetical protein